MFILKNKLKKTEHQCCKNIIFVFFILFFFSFNTLYRGQAVFSPKKFDSVLLKNNETLRLAGDYKGLVRLNQKYLQEANDKKYKEGVILCYLNIANISGTIGNYKRGMHYLSLAEKELKTVKSAILSARFYQEYGQISSVIGLYKNALSLNAKGLYYLKNTSEKENKMYYLYRLYANRADFLYKINQTDSSFFYLHKGLKINSDNFLLNALLAKHHLVYTNRTDSAYIYLQRAAEKTRNSGKINIQNGLIYLTFGDYYFKIKDYKTALEYYNKALDNYQKTHRLYSIPGIYESIAKTYNMLNDPENEKKAMLHYTLEKKDLENVQNEAINISVDHILSDNETEKNIFREQLFIYLAVIFLILLITFFLFYRHNRSLRLKKDKFQTETQSLKTRINASFEELVTLAKKNDSTFLTRFQEVYPDFCEKLLQINPKLAISELSFCAMVKLNFTSKEIAEYTFIQHKSAQQKKHRLRKKLNVPSDQDLFLFFDTL